MPTVRRAAGIAAFAAVFVASASASSARPQESVHNLRAVEAAFFRARVPFSQDWRPHPLNPYLVPARKGDPRLTVPFPLRHRLRGWAGGEDSGSFELWQVFVFDGARPAISFAADERARCKQPGCDLSVVRANNVVYFGNRIPRALRALAALRRR